MMNKWMMIIGICIMAVAIVFLFWDIQEETIASGEVMELDAKDCSFGVREYTVIMNTSSGLERYIIDVDTYYSLEVGEEATFHVDMKAADDKVKVFCIVFMFGFFMSFIGSALNNSWSDEAGSAPRMYDDGPSCGL